MRSYIKRPKAKHDLVEIFAYIGERNLRAARRFIQAAEKTMEFLAEMPAIGSTWESGRIELQDVRMLAVRGFRNYLIFYHVRDSAIEILRVLHGARDIESILLNDLADE